jgi:hypothetical protein
MVTAHDTASSHPNSTTPRCTRWQAAGHHVAVLAFRVAASSRFSKWLGFISRSFHAVSSDAGNAMDFTHDFNLSMANNGDVAAISNHKESSPRSQNFCYDSLNRIKKAAGVDSAWGHLLFVAAS